MAQVGTDPEADPVSGHSTDGQRRGRTPAPESLHFSEADFVHYDPEARSNSADGSTSTDSSTTESNSIAGTYYAPNSLRRSHSHDMLASRGLAWRLRTWRGSGGPRDHPHLFNTSGLATPSHAPPYPRHARITITTTDHDETDQSAAADRTPSPGDRTPSDDSGFDSSSDTASSRSLSPPRCVYHP